MSELALLLLPAEPDEEDVKNEKTRVQGRLHQNQQDTINIERLSKVYRTCAARLHITHR